MSKLKQTYLALFQILREEFKDSKSLAVLMEPHALWADFGVDDEQIQPILNTICQKLNIPHKMIQAGSYDRIALTLMDLMPLSTQKST